MKLNSTILKGLTPKKAKFVIEYVKDFAHRRAAEASSHDPDEGIKLLKDEQVAAAIEKIVTQEAEGMGVDAQWLLMELVDNHRIARHQGNIGASNTALLTIAKHVSVDALASDKHDVLVAGEKAIIERLRRGRQRVANEEDQGPSFL